MLLEVMAERCDQCLYGPNKIVSNARRREILLTIERENCYFICHKASIVDRQCACRGDWDWRGCGQIGRIAERLNAVKFVKQADLGEQA